MLKVTLTPNINLDKALESAYKGFYSVLDEAGKTGILRIYSYPSLDPLLASSMIFVKTVALDIKATLLTTIEPPSVIEEPSILVGFSELNYKVSDVKSKVLAVYSGELKSIPVHGATYVDGSGSHSVISYLIATGGKDYDPSYVIAVLAGAYTGRFVDKTGRFQGLDRILLDKLKLATRLSLEMVTTIKAYKPTIRDVCEAISLTSSPYYPGLTGDYDQCVRMLNTHNLATLLGVRLSSLDQKSLEGVALTLINFVKRSTGVELQPSDIVGGVLVSTSRAYPAVDFREAADTLLYSGETLGGPGRILATIIDVENEYPMAEYRLEGYSRRLQAILREVKPVKVKSNLKISLYELQLDKRDSPTLVWRALRTLGLVEQESIIATWDGGELRVSPFQVEEALGYGGCRRLKELGIATLRDDVLWVNKRVLA